MLREEQLQKIANNRDALLQQLHLKYAEPDHLAGWLNMVSLLKAEQIPFELRYLFCSQDAALRTRWLQALEQPPMQAFNFHEAHIPNLPRHPLQAEVYSLYPAMGAKGYGPLLAWRMWEPQVQLEEQVREEVFDFMAASGDQLFVFYNTLTPVLQFGEADLLRAIDLLTAISGSVCIVSSNLERMLCRSSDLHWSWGDHFAGREFYTPVRQRYYVHWAVDDVYEMDRIFSAAANELGLQYSSRELLSAEEGFEQSNADVLLYFIKGKNTWIEVQFEKSEAWFGWHCYTCDREILAHSRQFLRGICSQKKR